MVFPKFFFEPVDFDSRRQKSMQIYLQGSYSQLPPSIARFSPEEPDIVVYTGYGMNKQMQFYSLSQRKVTT